jgi:Ca-activated chloride channel family protein
MNESLPIARRVLLPLGAALLLAGVVLVARQATFRTGVQTVALYATVSDREGRLVPDLDRTAFEIRDNGRPVPITVFSNQIQAITVAVMLDMSGSMSSKFLQVRQSSLSFVAALGPRDRARIGTFGEEVAISPLLTGDRDVLTRIVQEELWPGGGTPLWKAIEVAMTSLAREGGRRVVLVLTDGLDSVSGEDSELRGSPSDLKRRATNESFMVYAIGMDGTGLDGDIEGLAEQSGGGHFKLSADADLSATFARVIDELRHQYVLGFAPAVLDGKDHKLEVRTMTAGLKVRAQKSYRAAPERQGPGRSGQAR